MCTNRLGGGEDGKGEGEWRRGGRENEEKGRGGRENKEKGRRDGQQYD